MSRWIENAFVRGTTFGKHVVSTDDLGVFTVKIFAFTIPSVILGYYVDKYIDDLKKQEYLGKSIINYILLQLLIGIIILYYLIQFSPSYTDEFQKTIAGMYFFTFYMGMQLKLLDDLQLLFK